MVVSEMMGRSRRSLLKAMSSVVAGSLLSDSFVAHGARLVTKPVQMAGAHGEKESFHFGFDALVALAQKGPAKANLVLSPASLIEALGLVDLGASPELHTALIKLLRLDPNDKEATSGLRRSVAPLFQQGRVAVPAVGVAAVYVDETTKLHASAQAAFRSQGAVLASCRLSDPATVQRINSMVKAHTFGRIDSVLGDRPTQSSGMILVNAFAFKDAWHYPFQASDTTDAEFLTRTGKVQVRMMHLEDESLDAAVQGAFTAIRLPYKDSRYSLILVGRSGAPASLEDFGPAAHLLTGDGFKTQPVNVSIPHVKLQGGEDLMGALDSMGLSSAWQRPDALRGSQTSRCRSRRFFIERRSTSMRWERSPRPARPSPPNLELQLPCRTSSPLLQTGLFCSPSETIRRASAS